MWECDSPLRPHRDTIRAGQAVALPQGAKDLWNQSGWTEGIVGPSFSAPVDGLSSRPRVFLLNLSLFSKFLNFW